MRIKTFMYKKKYTHIFFDLDNTLWDFRRNAYFAMQLAFKIHINHNSSITFDRFFEVYSHHNKQLWESYREQLVPKKELEWLRFQRTFDELAINDVDANKMNTLYLNEMPRQTALVPGAAEVLNHLKSKGYILSIISNGFREVQYKKLENTRLMPYFYKVFLSEEVKAPKPDKEIFNLAITSVNAKKNTSIMVGDEWDVDITGALNFGIDAVYFNPLHCNMPHNSQHKKHMLFQITRLNELVDITG